MWPPPFTFNSHSYHRDMELQQIEDRAIELDELEKSILETLENARKDLVDAQADTRAIRFINDIDKFLKGLVDEVSKHSTIDERFAVLANGVGKLAEYAKSEPTRLRDRAVAANEKVIVIEGTVGLIRSRKESYIGKAAAIKRVVDGTGDPKHPEKISTMREAERIKRLKKSDS